MKSAACFASDLFAAESPVAVVVILSITIVKRSGRLLANDKAVLVGVKSLEELADESLGPPVPLARSPGLGLFLLLGLHAFRAGLQRLDRLAEPAECAASISRYFKPRKDARTVEWTVRRPKGDDEDAS